MVETTNRKGRQVTRPRVTYHELRHTAATMMLTGGKSAVVVARQLGHRDARIMTQVYEHLLDDGLLDGALTLSYRDHTGDHAGEEEAAGREA